jgi:hypothetical protein
MVEVLLADVHVARRFMYTGIGIGSLAARRRPKLRARNGPRGKAAKDCDFLRASQMVYGDVGSIAAQHALFVKENEFGGTRLASNPPAGLVNLLSMP